MTTKEMIAVMQAYDRGEQIQFREYGCVTWEDCFGEPYWNWSKFDYRIQPKPMRWRAEKDGIYYFVGNDGIVRFTSDEYSKIDNRKYNIGNYFKTKEEAQVIANKFKDLFKENHNG